MGHLLKIKWVDTRVNVPNLASTSGINDQTTSDILVSVVAAVDEVWGDGRQGVYCVSCSIQ
jgi:hypothetical protein